MRRRLILLGCLLILPFVGCRTDEPFWPKNGKIRVLTSFPFLYCFAQNITGDDANVVCLLASQGPHGYKADHRDIIGARDADVFFCNGLQLNDSVTNIVNSSGNPKALFKVAETLPVDKLLRMGKGEHKHGPGEKDHHHGEYDPHVWLSPELSILMVETMAAKLGDIDAKNKAKYQERAKAYIADLKKLHDYGKKELAGKKNKKIISTHDALGYFGQAFGLEIVATIRPTAEDEAGGGKINELVKICKEQDVRVIASEPQYSARTAEIVQEEAGRHKVPVQVVEVDPVETAPIVRGTGNPDPGYYLKRMYENIDNLAKALK